MAKTVQAVGTTLLPEYSNAINGIDASTGVILDGANEDGHGPKLDLANHVQGKLGLLSYCESVQTFALEASVDGGSTYTINFSVDIVRNAVLTTVRFLSDVVFVMAVAGQTIKIRPVGGVDWDPVFFGTQQAISQAFPLSTLAPAAEALMARYTGISSDIDIFTSKFANFALNDDITLVNGTCITLTLQTSEA